MELRRLKNASLFFGPETEFCSHPLFSFHQVVSEALVVGEDAAAAVETDFSAVLTLEGKWKMIHFENGHPTTEQTSSSSCQNGAKRPKQTGT